MTEDNERLIEQFFSEAASQTIADNGFSERVIRRLPEHINWFPRLWTMFCVTVFAVLFVVFRGWELLAVHFEVMLRSLSVETISINILALATVLFGLLLVGVGETVSRA